MPKILPLEKLRAAPKRNLHSNLRVGASTSFNEAEVNALDQILSTMMRGGDTRKLAHEPIQALAKKIPAKQRRAELGAKS